MMKKMKNINRTKFLIISNSIDSLINLRLDLIKTLIGKGVTVHAACPISEELGKVELLCALGVRVHDVDMSRASINPLKDVLLFINLFKLIRRIRPDKVLSYTVKPIVWGSIAASWSGVSQIFVLVAGVGYTIAETDPKSLRRRLVHKVSKCLHRHAIKHCTHIFFQNPDDKHCFEELSLLRETQSSSVVKGSGINLKHFQQVRLPSNPIFLFIGRFLVDKGIREFLTAASIVNKKHSCCRFLLVGYIDDNPESITQQELEAWLSSTQISYLGKLSDVREAISQASVLVLPSYREGTPRSVLEAMAMGRAIITTDAPGCRETVKNKYNGLLIRPRSVDDLVDAMEYLIQNPGEVSKMGSMSLTRARIEFDVDKVNNHMISAMKII
jgi:glycosyltransferase involved in cell wall biosynthesis